MKKLVALTGAGISAESGLKTFRGSGGLWEGYDVTEVATPEAWERDRSLVLRFYNERRKQAQAAKPNAGHRVLAELEEYCAVKIITQNVDRLHEAAGSSRVMHLHGELSKSRSTLDPSLVYEIDGWELKEGDFCERGSQLRPHIVWFGESVPMIEPAAELIAAADIVIVAGTSLAVYPAAGLLDFVGASAPKFIVDPNIPDVGRLQTLYKYEEAATTGLPKVKEYILENFL